MPKKRHEKNRFIKTILELYQIRQRIMVMDKTIIGVDLGGTKVHSGRIEGYRIVRDFRMNISAQGKPAQVVDEIIATIEEVYNSNAAGIGIGVPGPVDVEKGTVYDLINIPAWKEVELGEILNKRFGIPVYINNDANCFAIGEKYFGKAREFKNIVGLIIGTGLGAGLIVDGKLYEGTNCGAGEVGMIPYRDYNFEYYCSGQFFQNQFKTTGHELALAAEKKDSQALSIFEEFGHHLGKALKAILYAYDPEMIIIGGSVRESFPFFKGSMFTELKDFSFSRSLKNVVIEVSENDQIALLGAGALYYDAQLRMVNSGIPENKKAVMNTTSVSQS
jgi:glucokinase